MSTIESNSWFVGINYFILVGHYNYLRFMNVLDGIEKHL